MSMSAGEQAVLLGLLAIVAVVAAFASRCPKCRAWFTAVELERNEISRQVFGSSLTITYRVRKRCARCKEEWAATESCRQRRLNL